ncbi:MAG: hypothetical protein WDZ42_00580 [Candidatus Saccharimonadales bacterium]
MSENVTTSMDVAGFDETLKHLVHDTAEEFVEAANPKLSGYTNEHSTYNFLASFLVARKGSLLADKFHDSDGYQALINADQETLGFDVGELRQEVRAQMSGSGLENFDSNLDVLKDEDIEKLRQAHEIYLKAELRRNFGEWVIAA